jgi:nucleotide-binding universal stress UspA family protein
MSKTRNTKMKILLAVDGSPYSDAAVEAVIKRPWPPNSEVKIVSAFETSVVTGIGVEPWPVEYCEYCDNSARVAAKKAIDNANRKLNEASDKTLRVSHELLGGPAKQAILDEAEKWGADLIVMGSRGLGAWSRLVLGSVSNAVAHHAKCSVEVVRTSRPA